MFASLKFKYEVPDFKILTDSHSRVFDIDYSFTAGQEKALLTFLDSVKNYDYVKSLTIENMNFEYEKNHNLQSSPAAMLVKVLSTSRNLLKFKAKNCTFEDAFINHLYHSCLREEKEMTDFILVGCSISAPKDPYAFKYKQKEKEKAQKVGFFTGLNYFSEEAKKRRKELAKKLKVKADRDVKEKNKRRFKK